ncbi:tyrosine-type recombinase/integrase [Sporosarcina cascadiensis]|uniref:tyrosine-type recombinase/integrase n=1 Tax=Sporosarcina cascadiensis TaxID=2660747 RepID=UPI00129AB695|nr:tyrosine-type recombinase/integrase [Sporosarcina cascadiensis]
MNQKTIKEFFDDNYNQFSKETVRAYSIALTQFFSHCEKPLNEVKAKDIRAWMASMTEEGLKPRSIQLKLVAVKSFYTYCLEENIVKQSPAKRVRSPQKEDSLPRYISRQQLALLREWTLDDVRERAIVEALYTTGVRISELLNIRLEDIKWESRQIWIRKSKNGHERFVSFTSACMVRMKAYLDTRTMESDYLFCNQRGQPLSQCLVQQRFREYSTALGFKVTPHTMRHTFATDLTIKGMEDVYLQDYLGHANLNSTSIYTRLRSVDQRREYDRYNS